MLRVKGSDTLCPLGPGLVRDWDFHGKRLVTRVNGRVAQEGSTDEMRCASSGADLARVSSPASSRCSS